MITLSDILHKLHSDVNDISDVIATLNNDKQQHNDRYNDDAKKEQHTTTQVKQRNNYTQPPQQTLKTTFFLLRLFHFVICVDVCKHTPKHPQPQL